MVWYFEECCFYIQIICDIDGDGQCELILGSNNRTIYIYRLHPHYQTTALSSQPSTSALVNSAVILTIPGKIDAVQNISPLRPPSTTVPITPPPCIHTPATVSTTTVTLRLSPVQSTTVLHVLIKRIGGFIIIFEYLCVVYEIYT